MSPPLSPYTQSEFGINPLMFYYEVTQACDLVCKHCRASAQQQPASDELTTPQSKQLIEQVASFPRKPHMVFTGGDPLKRRDLFELIEYARSFGITTALTPAATPLATRESFINAKNAGVQAFGLSLDGDNAPLHDAFRGFDGSFDKTLELIAIANELQIPVQVNTSITRRNFEFIDEIAELLAKQRGVSMWAVFFLVPVGRGLEEERISPQEYEIAFEKLWQHAQQKPFAVKTTEAPHYRRFVFRKGHNPLDIPRPFHFGRGTGSEENSNGMPTPVKHRAPLGVTDGRGIMFVSNNGTIYPAGFLPLETGRFPKDSVVETYQNHPIFKSLQNPDNYKGNCGLCEYRKICGGSRARAYALTGNPLESDPDCAYQIGQDNAPSV
ncbi:MAG: TIGR04053 family radical SAM/SPASM domain-containing protein [Planctomycetaceae bacterium]|nr:TIGR04053 family radical SAM/SPASM domain-containing protein [Planctomycetaceae bacterium]